jgi:prevent-host-death family protein
MYMTDEDRVVVTAAEFHRNVGHYQDVALTKPVAITKNGRDRTVLISAEEYERLLRRDRRVYLAGELPEHLVEAIRNAKVSEEYNYLNDELKDWKP